MPAHGQASGREAEPRPYEVVVVGNAGIDTNVYLDTPFAFVHAMLKEGGKRIPKKILFGTDAPAIHASVEMEKIRSLKLGKAVEEDILGGNIARLLKL